MDRLTLLNTFVRVAELGSFTRAADSLDSSRATVSQQIATLERELGARLLNRTTRRVTLTGDGNTYLERIRPLLEGLTRADESITQRRGQVRGRLRIDAPSVFSRYLLVPALPKFTQDYPELSLDIQFNDRVIDLVAERVDVALRVGHVTQKGLIARQIASLRVVTCAAPSYLEAHGTPRSIEELAEHRCIGLLSTGHGRLLEWIFERGTARLRHRPNCSLAFTSAEAIISAGIAGGGVLQTVDALASRAVATGQLRLILSECSTAGPPVSVVYPESSRNSAKVQVFAEFAARLMSDWRRKMGEI